VEADLEVDGVRPAFVDIVDGDDPIERADESRFFKVVPLISLLGLGPSAPLTSSATFSRSSPRSSTNSTSHPFPLANTLPPSLNFLPTHSLFTLHPFPQYPSSLFPSTSVILRLVVEIRNRRFGL
jgi:hypothetical protein